jgi:hypothetical protein
VEPHLGIRLISARSDRNRPGQRLGHTVVTTFIQQKMDDRKKKPAPSRDWLL